MKIKPLIFVISILYGSIATADEFIDKIKMGQTSDDVVSVMGSQPYNTDCSTTLGVKYCTLYWKIASFDKATVSASFYEISLVADRVISKSLQVKQGNFK